MIQVRQNLKNKKIDVPVVVKKLQSPSMHSNLLYVVSGANMKVLGVAQLTRTTFNVLMPDVAIPACVLEGNDAVRF